MTEEKLIFKSSGKFLISAEYLILKGAKGLALPLKKGQTLYIHAYNTSIIHWKSVVFNSIWFEASFQIKDFEIQSSTDDEIAKSLQQIFQICRHLNPLFLSTGVDAAIKADFNLSWGLGSSSTLINNMANWAKVDPYVLLEKTFGGSGYDIACAGASGPITYQLTNTGPLVSNVAFHPTFSEHIFFVYLGKKMNSRTGMSYFKQKANYTEIDLIEVNKITDGLIECKHLSDFEKLCNLHESILSKILQLPTIKESHFNDYPYAIKSMGAWGGDFVLVIGDTLDSVKSYFHKKGLDTVVPYNDIVLS